MYFFQSISDEVREYREIFQTCNQTMKLILFAIFSCIAAILQAAGGLLPGIGYLISPLATAPILLASMFSIPLGVLSYFLTIMLLVILQPSELFIFPFTTGILGIGIGMSFSLFKKRIAIISGGAITLTLGIISLLYIFHFPILGPAVSHSFSLLVTGSITLFTFLYSWLWVELGSNIFKRFKGIMK